MVAKLALQHSKEDSRTLIHSTARYKAATAARAMERVSRVQASNAMGGCGL